MPFMSTNISRGVCLVASSTFNLRLSTSSSTIAALHTGAHFFRGIDERQPTATGKPRRFRAPLLGRQRQRNLRAPLLLRRVLLARRLPPGKAEFLDRADR